MPWNNLIIQTRATVLLPQQTFTKRLLGVLAYRPAPPLIHLIDPGNGGYIGYLPQTVNADIRINDIYRSDLDTRPIWLAMRN